MDLAQIYAPIQHDLDALDGLLRAELASEDPLVGELVTYVLSTRGKLVRPALTCLAAEAIGGGEEERLYLAGTVELIHIASLIHDDIIDQADVRRGSPTVNVQWGNQLAVLLGDLLFARAFDLISRVRHPQVAPAVAHAAVRMSQAEIKQLEYAAEPHQHEGVYLEIIEGKTAALFSAACRGGALLAGGTAEQAAALAEFGLSWGMSFQITDDTLDLTSRPEALGKPIGSDIQGGKVTLPVIHALRCASPGDRAELLRLLQTPSADGQVEEVRPLLDRYGAIEYAVDVARRYAARAAAALEALPPSPARQSLRALTEFVLVRPR
ncbi:MAG: polyprenyl synthetase family protein [Armatimonadota bacterium]|nr:polyprenyl synthetase family protein [Armatimonadota bacterium]MDR7468879.1 polyprenyl synthetase family protein [Armatimonadota bacterium]